MTFARAARHRRLKFEFLEELSSEDPDKKAQMKILERYLDRHGVPSDTRLAARSHFVFLHNRLLTSKFRALFADLPLELRSRLEASARVPALNRCAMFGPARRTGAQVAVARAMVNAVYAQLADVRGAPCSDEDLHRSWGLTVGARVGA